MSRVTFFVLACICVVILFSNCKKTALSPARSLAGTWTSPYAITFYMASEGCGSYVRYNSTPVTITWTITAIDDNDVDVVISSNKIGTTTQLASNCGLPATLAFPLEFHGTISSSNLQLTERQMQYSNSGAAIGLASVVVGNFNFTNNNITGTIFEKDCPAYCAGFQTDNNACIVTR